MPLLRKKIFRLPPPPPGTIYVRPGYNRVLAEEFEALKRKRVDLVRKTAKDVKKPRKTAKDVRVGHETG